MAGAGGEVRRIDIAAMPPTPRPERQAMLLLTMLRRAVAALERNNCLAVVQRAIAEL